MSGVGRKLAITGLVSAGPDLAASSVDFPRVEVSASSFAGYRADGSEVFRYDRLDDESEPGPCGCDDCLRRDAIEAALALLGDDRPDVAAILREVSS